MSCRCNDNFMTNYALLPLTTVWQCHTIWIWRFQSGQSWALLPWYLTFRQTEQQHLQNKLVLQFYHWMLQIWIVRSKVCCLRWFYSLYSKWNCWTGLKLMDEQLVVRKGILKPVQSLCSQAVNLPALSRNLKWLHTDFNTVTQETTPASRYSLLQMESLIINCC